MPTLKVTTRPGEAESLAAAAFHTLTSSSRGGLGMRLVTTSSDQTTGLVLIRGIPEFRIGDALTAIGPFLPAAVETVEVTLT